MNTQKFIVSGIVGGIVSCLVGYLIYGTLLKDFFATNSTVQTMRTPETMIWWSLILGCIFSGLLYSYIFNKWANINSFGSGLGAGFVLGLLNGIAMDLIMYGTSSLYGLKATAVDIACGAVLGALVGATVGWMNGMQSKKAAA